VVSLLSPGPESDNPHYARAVGLLTSRTASGVRLGLERTRALLGEMGDPHLAVPVIHFAGTNGKGSCVATTEAILRGKGLRVGTYTSPHLVDFRERIRLVDEHITESEVATWVERWMPAVEQLGATFFEATTAMAFEWFHRRDADIVIAETGLGGRLDSTNVVDPLAAAVVSISREHTDLLGDSIEAIAAEKGGIFKPGRPAVIGRVPPGAREVLESAAVEVGAGPVVSVEERLPIAGVQVDGSGTRVLLGGNQGPLEVRSPLIGEHQAANLACALVTLEAAGHPWATSAAELGEWLSAVRLPGRFERVGDFIFDVAHNPEGIRALVENLRRVGPPHPISALVCILADKEWQPMLTELALAVDRLVLTHAPSVPAGRQWSLPEVIEFAAAQGMRATVEPDFDAALAAARRGGATCLVTGSFHTVGDAMARLQLSPLTR
jgi:dihydrofolate synthase / folylpolyglutamate synthase